MSDESKQWYLMSRPLFNSGYEDDEFFAYGVDGFNEILNSFAGEIIEVYDKKIYVKPMFVRAIVQNVTSDVITNSYIRQVLCNVGVLKCGQYIKIRGSYWIVSSLPDNNGIYEKAVLWKCKYAIRFVSPLTGNIVEYPTYSLNSTQYGTGELNKTNISVGEAQHLVYLPYNEETILLDTRFRFIMDRNKKNPSVYRITQVDPVSYAVGFDDAVGLDNEDGILQWSVLETQFNEKTDNRALMVADYYTSQTVVTPNHGSGQSVVLHDLDGDFRLAVGEIKRFSVSFGGDSGTVATPFPYSVSINQEGDIVEVGDVSVDGFSVIAHKDYNNVGKKVLITVVCDGIDSNASAEILIVNW